MKVSVVMPVYNAEKTVLRALESLRVQTLQPIEIIVINDGSTDGTLKLLRRQHDIMLLDHSRRGIAAALNDGITAAAGDYIARMDADDICRPARLEEQASFLNVFREIGIAGCRVAYGGSRERQPGYAGYADWINTLIDPDTIALNRFIESPFAHSSVLFRRELFEQFGAYRDGSFPEDYELWLRWMANGVKAGKVDDELLVWNNPPERLSRTDARCSTDAFCRIKSEYLALWLQENNPHHPDVIIWGAGRVTRKRAAVLESFGIRVTGCIDLKSRTPENSTAVMHHNDIPEPETAFIVAMVGSRGARGKIRSLLNNRGFKEGKNCIFAA